MNISDVRFEEILLALMTCTGTVVAVGLLFGVSALPNINSHITQKT
jgi:hypothetical protein